jgi:hypothetical protein
MSDRLRSLFSALRDDDRDRVKTLLKTNPDLARHAVVVSFVFGSATRSNFAFAGPLTEAVLLGSVCIRNGGDKLVWNSEKMEFTNDPDANKYLDYEHRDGWKL